MTARSSANRLGRRCHRLALGRTATSIPMGGEAMSNGVAATANSRVPVPRDRENDYTLHAANERQAFVHERTGVELQNVGSFSFDPAIITGNIEQFIGVAQ